MLSHRWEDDELAFERLKGQSVYDLPASIFQKVRGFCRQAATQGFDWAWVDTCCIDQTSSADVSESISSMFSWYRGSALTIIYLSDVATSNVQALLRSQWFRRGWTLQELLAANVIQIYKRDWGLEHIFSCSIQPQGRFRDPGCARICNWNRAEIPRVLFSERRAASNEACMGSSESHQEEGR